MENRACSNAAASWLWTLVNTTLFLVACGGSQKSTDHYRASVDQQRACCGELHDPTERAACIDQIVTVDDMADEGDVVAVEDSSQNQATYRCMHEHFTCDPQTGRATAASQQAQLDCINDIGQ
jgi:hypothetical protein